MMKYNNYIANYLKDIIKYQNIFEGVSPRGTDQLIDKFYDVTTRMSKAQMVDLIWLIFCHIECNELFDEYEDIFNEFIENILEVE